MAIYGYVRGPRFGDPTMPVGSWPITAQRREIKAYCRQHGMNGRCHTVVEDDEEISGATPVEDRPAGRRLFVEWLKSADVVIATRFDHLFCSALDALKVVANLERRGVGLHVLDIGGDIAGVSKLFMTMASAFAEGERDQASERIRQAKADQKSRGRYLGGKVPFGFRSHDDGSLVKDEAEQKAILEIALLKAGGESLRAIAAAMVVKGHKISHEGVAAVLRAHPDAVHAESTRVARAGMQP